MNKPFCDICGKPALGTNPSVRTPVGPEWEGTLDGVQGRRTPTLELWGTWRMFSHKTISHQNPCDLCADCLLGLLTKLKQKIVETTSR